MRKIGIEAYSNDILPCSGGHPEWHLQVDVKELLGERWDMVIAFPPCTYLSVSGNRWFNIERYGDLALQRHVERQKAIDFFMMFASLKCERVAIENPIGIMSSVWRKPDCIISPYQFGDPVEKKTCLWLKNLPVLTPTNIVKTNPRNQYRSGKSFDVWYDMGRNMKADERRKHRSKTFQGIAIAMAEQWGGIS